MPVEKMTNLGVHVDNFHSAIISAQSSARVPYEELSFALLQFCDALGCYEVNMLPGPVGALERLLEEEKRDSHEWRVRYVETLNDVEKLLSNFD